jgi:hypothetical protein
MVVALRFQEKVSLASFAYGRASPLLDGEMVRWQNKIKQYAEKRDSI